MKIIGVFAQLAGGKDTVANYLAKALNGGDGQTIGHSSNPEYEKLVCDKHMEALRDRTVKVELPWRRLGFADAVKHVFMQSFNVTWEWIEEWKRKDEVPPGFDLPVRKGLQHIGDGFRKIQADVWIRKAMQDNVIISDGRYINEAKVIKEQGGFNILLWRPGFENDDPNPSESQIRPYIDYCAMNYKEGPLSDLPPLEPHPPGFEYFDYFLINNGTVQDLYSKIDNKLVQYLQETGIK